MGKMADVPFSNFKAFRASILSVDFKQLSLSMLSILTLKVCSSLWMADELNALTISSTP